MDGTARVTMRDVAEASGVSRATVSFVLNDVAGQTIPRETRARVTDAAARLGYVPNAIARALREGSSRIVVLDIRSSLETNYSRTYIRGLGDELERHGHLLLVHHLDASAGGMGRLVEAIKPRAVLHFAERFLDGSATRDPEPGDAYLARHAVMQVEYLHARGHRHLALAVPVDGSPLAAVRVGHSQAAARDLGLPTPVIVELDEFSREQAVAAVQSLMERVPETTAIAAFNDDIALRVLAAAHDLALDVPRRLAVLGYDASPHSAFSTPALTTIEIDAEVHGRLAARHALGLAIDDLPATTARFIERGSV